MHLPFPRQVVATTRSRLILLVGAIFGPLVLFGTVLFLQFAAAGRARYGMQSLDVAQHISAAVDREVIAAIASLEALATSPALAQNRDLVLFQAQALAVLRDRGAFIALRDRSGRELVSTLQNAGAPPSADPALLAADRRVIETGKPAISDLYDSAWAGQKLVMAEVPVFRDGAVAEILGMAIRPAAITEVLAAVAPPGWVASLVDRNGRIIARVPQHTAYLGGPPAPDLLHHLAQPPGYWKGTTLEGTLALSANTRSQLSGWSAAVGVPVAVIEAPLRDLTALLAAAALLVLVLATALARRVSRTINEPLGQLADSAARLGRGEAVAPIGTGLAEVDEVAGALAAAGAAITERERALHASQARFSAAVRAVDGIVWSNDPQGRMTGAQPGWSALTGQSQAEYEGYGWSKSVHPDDAQPTIEAWEQAVRKGQPFLFEHRVRRRDGVYRLFSIRAIPVQGADGAVAEWVGVHTDITDERAAQALVVQGQAQLRELNATLERRVEAAVAERDRVWRISPLLMLIVRTDGEIVAVNAAWTATLGWLEAELIGANILPLLHPEDHPRPLDNPSDGAPGTHYLHRLRHKDGSYRWVSWAAVPEAGLIHGIGRDVTEEKAAAEILRRTEAQLRQSQKMEVVGQLTGGIAHDFNNLLTVVSGNLEMALRRLEVEGGSPRLVRGIGAALDGARRAATLTSRLLAFSRQSALQPEPLNLNAIIAGMADLIRRTLGETIEIETRFADALWTVEADPNQIENAILNLCVNARDAMPDGGTLTVETGNTNLNEAFAAVERGELKPGPYAMVAVADTGTGMTREVQERVFEPFFTTKPIGKGTGLGLSQVFGFLRQSGGYAAIDSTPGEGTTVRLFFPRLAQGVAAAPEHVPDTQLPAPGTGEAILVVEDEEMVREFTVSALEEGGYRVLAAHDGPSGLDLLRRHPEVALLFTDMVLTGSLNGRAVADQAQAQLPGLKVLFTTGYTRDAITRAGQADDSVQVITKPFTAAALLEKVHLVLGRITVP